MIISLVRHFKVDLPPQKIFINSEDFRQSMEDYDSSPVIKKEININPNDWGKCYTSTMQRAVTTAKAIYPGEIILCDDIREVQMYPRFKSNLRFPSISWGILARIGWYRSHQSQAEDKNHTKNRIDKFFNTITVNNEDNILVVTHVFFMRLLAARLKKEGFEGKCDLIPKNGAMYIFKK